MQSEKVRIFLSCVDRDSIIFIRRATATCGDEEEKRMNRRSFIGNSQYRNIRKLKVNTCDKSAEMREHELRKARTTKSIVFENDTLPPHRYIYLEPYSL